MESVQDKFKHEEAIQSFIIFLFERLLERDGSRPITHLIGTFGRSDCTLEMRHVGGTADKIKEFVSQHPTLFLIEGENVKINTSPASTNDSSADMVDHTTEAVKYFSEKMAYYVEGTKIPIRVIIGYQSLASPEVQKASGYKARHICDFLLKHPDNFLLTNNNQCVTLKNYNNYKPRPYAVRCTLGGSTDSDIIKRLMDYLALHAGLKDQPYQNIRNRLLNWRAKPANKNTQDIKWRDSSNINYICSIEHCEIATKKILDAVQKDSTQGMDPDWPFTPNRGRIAFDCESITVGKLQEIVVMEIATLDGQVYIFDIKSCCRMIQSGLKQILESPDVVKIVHNCRIKSFTMFTHWGITLCNVFDTVSAHEVLTFQKAQIPVHRVTKLTLSRLFDRYKVPMNLRDFHFNENSKNHNRVWLNRPLSAAAVNLVAAKLSGLIHERIYPSMAEAIVPEYRVLFLDLIYEQIFWNIKRAETRSRKLQRRRNFNIAVLHVKLTQSNNDMILKKSELKLLNFIDIPEADKEKLIARSNSVKRSMPVESKSDSCSSDMEQDNIESSYMDYEIIGPSVSYSQKNELTTLKDSCSSDDETDNLDYNDKPPGISDTACIDPFSGNFCTCSECRTN